MPGNVTICVNNPEYKDACNLPLAIPLNGWAALLAFPSENFEITPQHEKVRQFQYNNLVANSSNYNLSGVNYHMIKSLAEKSVKIL